MGQLAIRKHFPQAGRGGAGERLEMAQDVSHVFFQWCPVTDILARSPGSSKTGAVLVGSGDTAGDLPVSLGF